MAAAEIGTVQSGSGGTWEVRWDAASKDVYVRCQGGLLPTGSTHVGKAGSAREAMTRAEAYVYAR